MKTDFFLFFFSLLFSILGLLLEDITAMGLQWVAVLRYFPILILYVKYFNRSFAAIAPILFAVFLFLLSALGGRYNFIGMVVTMMVPISLYVYTRIRFSRRQISIMSIMMTCALLLYVVIVFSNHFDINPNQESFKVLILTVGIFFCKYTNGKTKNILNSPGLCFLLLLALVVILYTECRNSLLVYILLVMAFVFRKKVAKMNIWGLIMITVLALFILYPISYCLLSDNLRNSSQNTEMLGQDVFSGRQYIWSYIFAQLTNSSSLYFGNIDMEWWGKSMHNSALDIVVRYGVPTAIAVMLIIFYYFKKVCSMVNNKYKPLLLLIVVTMIWGINESGIFLGFSFFLFMPYCILLSKNNEVRYIRVRSES